MLSSLLQSSTSAASEDSNSLFPEVCPHEWHFNNNTPLSLRICLTRRLSALSPSYGSCCLWNALLCCHIRPPQSPSRTTASRYRRVRASLLQSRRSLLRPENQGRPPDLSRSRRPGLSRGLLWKGVWTRYTETQKHHQCALTSENLKKKSFPTPVVHIFSFIHLVNRMNNHQLAVYIHKQLDFARECVYYFAN